MRRGVVVLVLCVAAACRGTSTPPPPSVAARNLLIITIDTLRADHVGAYGDRAAQTPAIDALAARGTLFEHAFAPTPVTLPSHASLMTGRYPAGHGARHNGMRLDLAVPTLAERLASAGFATAGFVGAFPLDRRFGLIKGFQTYGDRMPRTADGRPANERAGREVVDEAITWLTRRGDQRFFLWVHLFEPHAPYGDVRRGGSTDARYREDIAEADRQVARLLAALGDRAASTVIVLAADHGEAFGEHGEISHSVFVYDTTLRIPLIVAGPNIATGARMTAPVSLVDVAPTLAPVLGVGTFDADGVNIHGALGWHEPAPRPLYAETFAPLLDFGWSPLRAVRDGEWKYIDAPTPELYRIVSDGGETTNVIASEGPRAAALKGQLQKFGSAALAPRSRLDPESAGRLQALGYVGGGAATTGPRADPKDKKDLAARIARVTSGELQGDALEKALRGIVAEDPQNPQANLRLGYALLASGGCAEATKRFRTAIAARLPSADAHLGLAACQVMRREFAAAAETLRDAERVEPGSPLVLANLGVVLSDSGKPDAAIDPLQRALTTDPDFHQARFALAIAFARAGRRADAARMAQELLRRLPADAPQRAEVQRLLQETR